MGGDCHLTRHSRLMQDPAGLKPEPSPVKPTSEVKFRPSPLKSTSPSTHGPREDTPPQVISLLPNLDIRGHDYYSARIMAEFANLAYYDDESIIPTLQKKEKVKPGEHKPKPKPISLHEIFDYHKFEHETYTTVLTEEAKAHGAKLCGGGKAISDTQWLWVNNEEFIVLVFRGTEGTKLRDIWADLNAFPVVDWKCYRPEKLEAAKNKPAKIKVHAGFKNALDDVWPEVVEVAKAAYAAGKKIFICGHSLGGALATLCAARLALGLRDQVDIFAVYTYGCPRVGNMKFAEKCDKIFGDRHFRYVNNNDMVPGVPLNIMGYMHCGQQMYITSRADVWENPAPGEVFADGIRGRVADGLFNSKILVDHLADHMMNSYVESLVKYIEKVGREFEEEKAIQGPMSSFLLSHYWRLMSIRNYRDESYLDQLKVAQSNVANFSSGAHPAEPENRLTSQEVRDIILPHEESEEKMLMDNVLCRSITFGPSNKKLGIQTAHDPVYNAEIAVTNSRLVFTKAKERAHFSKIREVPAESLPFGHKFMHELEYVLDDGTYYASIPMKNITGVRFHDAHKSIGTTTVGAFTNPVLYILLFLCAAFLAGGMHSTFDQETLIYRISISGQWEILLVLGAIVYLYHFCSPRFSHSFDMKKPIVVKDVGLQLTFGFIDPVAAVHTIATMQLDSSVSPQDALRLCRIVEQNSGMLDRHAQMVAAV
eukprot:NODE_69_length_2300_cov_246.337628_g49_i0.p1 GENE.NODE_69_length_2300_cov_246.337628_g49_i0~~NODE_69_length_2300_cov_246.337628_g49_i0.p1  ORF type:complete len:708 (-),score=235.51 NODE_69_length_2300_cov_246.337628_g49_i0:148-2271(-)